MINQVGTDYPIDMIHKQSDSVYNNSTVYQSLNLINNPENFRAGKTKNLKENWFKLTHDKWIRDTISSYRVEVEEVPKQFNIPNPIKFSDEE